MHHIKQHFDSKIINYEADFAFHKKIEFSLFKHFYTKTVIQYHNITQYQHVISQYHTVTILHSDSMSYQNITQY